MSISLHPGAIKTDLARYSASLAQRIGRLVTYSVSYGAISLLYAGTAPDAGELNGKVSIYRLQNMLMTHQLGCIVLVYHHLGTGHTSQ